MKRIAVIWLLFVAIVGTGLSRTHAQGPSDSANPVAIALAEGRALPNQLLIQFRPGASELDKRQARGWVNAQRRELLRGNGGGELELATLPPGGSLDNAIALLSRHTAVAFAEPNWIYTHEATSDDPYFLDGSLWGMYGAGTTPFANPYGSQATKAWTAGSTGTSSVMVGVIDEGIDFHHPDLAANIWTNPYDPPDGVDNDGNGYVDDIHGWDFVHNDNSIFDGGSGSDVDAHGTHVSGTIGGIGGNGIGVAGINWNVAIISAKFLGPNGGYLADAVKALDYLTALKTLHPALQIVATNNSWGGGGYSQALHDAIIRAAKKEILFVAAAGNGNQVGVGQNNDSKANYPSNYNTSVGTSTQTAASYDAVIAVAAICGSSGTYCSSAGSKAAFSNYGATTVDLGAPGVGIYSTTPTNTYSSYSGTSMATPHVTGAAALYKSMNPGATAAAIKAAILASAQNTPTTSLAGITVTGGRLNIGLFVTAPQPPPAPTNLVATPNGSQIALSWNASDGATSYNVLRSATSGSGYGLVASGVATTSYNDLGLANGTYYYVVQAVKGGTSPNSNEASATICVAPPAPGGLTAAAGDSQVSLTWSGMAGVTFNVKRSGSTIASGLTTPAHTDTGLTNGVTYSYTVSATSCTEGADSAPVSATPTAGSVQAPAAPTNLVASQGPGAKKITLTWTGSTGATSYTVKRSSSSGGPYTMIATGVTSTTYANTGVSSGTRYYYVVSAVNSVGESANSNESSATTR